MLLTVKSSFWQGQRKAIKHLDLETIHVLNQ